MIHPNRDAGGTRYTPMYWQAAAVVAIVLAVLATAYFLNDRAEQSVRRTQELAFLARTRSIAAANVLDALKDAETGQRGFLLTAQDEYLSPYLEAKVRLEPLLQALGEVSRDAPWLVAEVANLRGIAMRELAELAESLRLDREQGRAAALAFVRSGAGKATMDAARESVARILAATSADRERQVALLREGQQDASRGVAIAAATGAVALGATVLVLLVARRRLIAARDQARLQTARLGGAVEHMRDGVAVFDGDGRLLLSNEHVLGVTGWPASVLRDGATFGDFAAVAAHWPRTPLADPRPGQAVGATEVRLPGKVLEVWRSPMPDGGQMLTVADTTRRAEAEAIARQAQKMEALGQLTGGVAHDFNNLLQVVSANLELLGTRIRDDAWLQARLSAAMSGVERAARLTRHLLAFARRQPLAPESIDTRALLANMEEMLRRTLGERVAVEMVLSGGLWPVRADPQQLENALLNLAINARDAMPDGGKLTIEGANASLDDQYAAAHAEVTPGQYVVVAVTDTGIGMTAEQLARALEPFYTTKTNGRGTGLGLPMVYGFSKQSDGHFKLYSEPGHGTTARLYLPRSKTAPRLTVEPTPAPAPADGEMVLVVEDDATVRAASVLALRGLGYRVVEASGSGAALALIEGGTRPDILFTDVVMPGNPTAREMAELARGLVPDLAVVFTSGYTANAIVHNGQLDSGVILVSKPWRTAELAQKLRQALQGVRNPAAVSAKLRVVIVEDEMLVRMTTADMVADLGHEVMESASGEQALAALEGGADLLLTDLGLPDMDGLELVARARARLPGLRVIVASGREAVPSEDYVLLEKPYDQAALRRAIDAAGLPHTAE